MQSFYVVIHGGKFVEVLAEPLSQCALKFFIQKKKEGYCISESRSGMLMVSGRTKQEALTKLKEFVDRLSKEGIQKTIQKAIDDNGISPCYRDAEGQKAC